MTIWWTTQGKGWGADISFKLAYKKENACHPEKELQNGKCMLSPLNSYTSSRHLPPWGCAHSNILCKYYIFGVPYAFWPHHCVTVCKMAAHQFQTPTPSTSLRHPSSNPCHSWQRTQSPTWKLEWSNMPSVTVSVYHNLLKGIRLWHWKQNACWHRIWMRENGSSLNFNFTSLPKSRGRWELCLPTSSVAQLSSGKWCHVWLSIYLNFLWMANFLNVSLFFSVHGQAFVWLFSSTYFIDCELQSSYSIIFSLFEC